MERIAAGKIRVPKFQRTFVWKQQDMHALLGSVLHGFPIGSILVWDTAQDIESTDRVGPIEVSPPPDGVVGYLLDGQQRVSTLFGTLRFQDEGTSIVDSIDWRVYFDLQTLEFLRSPSRGVRVQHFPMASLLDTAGFIEVCRRIMSSDEDRDRLQRWVQEADRLANAFRNYQLPLIYVREADLDTAVSVFARLNRTGRKISADEMVSALTYRKGEFHLAEKLDGFKCNLANQGFKNLDRVFLLRAVLAALGRDIYAKDWADLVVKQDLRTKLPESFEAAAGGINNALIFLKGLGVTSDRLLPYGLQLVMLGEFFRLCPEPDDGMTAKLRRWFWVTSFTGWFGGGSSTQATRALREIRDLALGKGFEFSAVDLDAPALPFPNRFDGRSARVRAFLLYLVSLHPQSIRNPDPDKPLDPGHLFSTLGTRTVGHLASKAINPPDLFGSPANRIFLDHDILEPAFNHITDLSDDMLRKLLPSHGFPTDSLAPLRNGDFATVIRERLDTLINGERDFLTERGVTPPLERTAAAIADSDASDESD